jgi:hypothetical protein
MTISPYRFDVAQKATVDEIREDQNVRVAHLVLAEEADKLRDEKVRTSDRIVIVNLKSDEKREVRVGDRVKIRITIERD